MAGVAKGDRNLRRLTLVVCLAAVITPLVLGWETASWIAAVVAVPLGLYVAIRAESAGPSTSNRQPLGRVDALQALASALGSRYDDQRSVGDEPIPVRWRTTLRAVMDDWSSIRDDGKPEPLTLNGSFAQIDTSFYQLSWRRLAIIGSAGSGKTEIGLHLARRLLQPASDIVPLFLTATAWRVESETLQEWATRTLVDDFPALRAPAVELYDGSGPVTHNLAADLLHHRHVVPLIDGLDELPEPLQVRALGRLQTEAPKFAGFVVLCRSAEFERAVTHPEGTVLPRTAVIEVEALDDTFVRSSLLRATSPRRRSKWDVLDQETAKAAQLREMLRTPLLLEVMTVVYARTGRDTRELVEDTNEDVNSIRSRTIGLYIRGRYASPPTGVGDVPDEGRALAWLQWLARHLRSIGAPDFAWWELDRALPRSLRALAMAALNVVLTLFVVYAVERLALSPSASIQSAAIMTSTTGLTVLVGSATRVSFRPTEPQLRRPTWPELRLGLVVGTSIGLVVGTAFSLLIGSLADLHLGLRFGVTVGAGVGLLIGIVAAFASGLGTPVRLETALSPGHTFRNAQRGTLLYAVVAGLGTAVPVGILFWVLDDLAGEAAGRTIPAVSFGIAQGLSAGVATASTCLFMTAWSRYVFTSAVLALGGRMPWRPLKFALQAQELRLLRRSGAQLQFRHDLFREWIVESQAQGRRRTPPRRPEG